MAKQPLRRSLNKLDNLLHWADEYSFAGAKDPDAAYAVERNFDRAKKAMIEELERLHARVSSAASKKEGN